MKQLMNQILGGYGTCFGQCSQRHPIPYRYQSETIPKDLMTLSLHFTKTLSQKKIPVTSTR
jgi:hypothetical protein